LKHHTYHQLGSHEKFENYISSTSSTTFTTEQNINSPAVGVPYSQAEGDINLPVVSEKQWIVAQVSLNTASDVD
jgi:hypothetical protein